MKFLFPVPPNSPVTQDFAGHVLRAKLNGWTNYNGGIDWGIPTGTPVKAAQAGKVAMVRNDASGYGTHIRIEHDEGYLTIYGHLQNFAVKTGDRVSAGQVIGRSDNTGFSTGPHLHFELRKNNVAVDPAPLLVEQLEPAPDPISTEPGKKVTIRPFYNLRAGPGTNTTDLGTTDAAISAEVIETQGDWARVCLMVWVHKGGIL